MRSIGLVEPRPPRLVLVRRMLTDFRIGEGCSSSSAAGSSVSAIAKRRIGRHDFSSNCQSGVRTTRDWRRAFVAFDLNAT